MHPLARVQHYYAIASKATLVKPADLPVPAAKFEEAFGLPWADALSQGRVFNALGEEGAGRWAGPCPLCWSLTPSPPPPHRASCRCVRSAGSRCSGLGGPLGEGEED